MQIGGIHAPCVGVAVYEVPFHPCGGWLDDANPLAFWQAFQYLGLEIGRASQVGERYANHKILTGRDGCEGGAGGLRGGALGDDCVGQKGGSGILGRAIGREATPICGEIAQPL